MLHSNHRDSGSLAADPFGSNQLRFLRSEARIDSAGPYLDRVAGFFLDLSVQGLRPPSAFVAMVVVGRDSIWSSRAELLRSTRGGTGSGERPKGSKIEKNQSRD